MYSSPAEFAKEKMNNIELQGNDEIVCMNARAFIESTYKYKYVNHFSWLGMPVMQFPQDLMAMQEIIYNVKPDCIIETGVGRGGSIVFYASMLHLLGINGKVIGIDFSIDKNNLTIIQEHSMFRYIKLIQGNSLEDNTIKSVRDFIDKKQYKKIMVLLDSSHEYSHVLSEMIKYSNFVSNGSYLVVFWTLIEDLPESFCHSYSWKRGNSPKTAIDEFLKQNNRFVIDKELDHKLLISTAPSGYLKCINNAINI